MFSVMYNIMSIQKVTHNQGLVEVVHIDPTKQASTRNKHRIYIKYLKYVQYAISILSSYNSLCSITKFIPNIIKTTDNNGHIHVLKFDSADKK